MFYLCFTLWGPPDKTDCSLDCCPLGLKPVPSLSLDPHCPTGCLAHKGHSTNICWTERIFSWEGKASPCLSSTLILREPPPHTQPPFSPGFQQLLRKLQWEQKMCVLLLKNLFQHFFFHFPSGKFREPYMPQPQENPNLQQVTSQGEKLWWNLSEKDWKSGLGSILPSLSSRIITKLAPSASSFPVKLRK